MKKWIKVILGVLSGIIMLLVVDFLCIFTINRPIFAIKKDNVYKGLLYDTYNCVEYSALQIKPKWTKFACSDLNTNEVKESVYETTEVENVSISISDISLTGATVTIKDTNLEPYVYGEWYKLEKEINGKWYELQTIIKDYGFNSIAYLPDNNDEIKFVMDWEWLYGKLSLGSYRILKEVGNRHISVSFDIATTSNAKIEVVKLEEYDAIKFNKYLERDNRIVYLSGNLKDVFYYSDLDARISLKDYMTKSYQTIEDSIKHLTDLMKFIEMLKDGGTAIYKSKEYDITLIKCNTVLGNKDVFIGDYLMKFDSNLMCK